MGSDSGARRLRAFSSLAANKTLLRVLAGYVLFVLTENSVWIAMLVFAYGHGGATVAAWSQENQPNDIPASPPNVA